MKIDDSGSLQLEATSFFGESVAVLGIKGSGKTNTSAVLIEELLTARVPLTIVDIENEYYGLKEKFDLLIVGQGENADLNTGIAGADALAAFSVTQSVSVILDMSEFDEDDAQEFLLAYFEGLWVAASKTPKPYMVVLEEAHEFIPQGVRTPLKKILTRIALRGRKRGLGTIMISQRSAKVEKDLLTQAGLVFLHTVVHPADMGVYVDILGMPKGEVLSRVSQLQRGQAMVKHYGKMETVQIRRRDTFHAGNTPGMDTTVAPELRKIDAAMLAELKKLTENRSPVRGQNQVDVLLRQLQERERTISEQAARIKELEARVKTFEGIENLAVAGDIPRSAVIRAVEIAASLPVVIADEKVSRGEFVTTNGNHKPMPHVSELAERRAVNNQKRRFDMLVAEIASRDRREVFILQYLLFDAEREFTTHELAASTGYSSSTLIKSPPTWMIRKGLIARTGKGNHNYKYSAKGTRQWLAKEFPALDVEGMVRTILAVE